MYCVLFWLLASAKGHSRPKYDFPNGLARAERDDLRNDAREKKFNLGFSSAPPILYLPILCIVFAEASARVRNETSRREARDGC